MSKDKLTIDEQIEHMKKDNGISFKQISEDDAKRFLTNNTYYFKIKAYAKNYEKYKHGPNKGKYINLDFAYLIELSTLDSLLRKLIIKMALDIEHFLKVELLRDFSDNEAEDGYSIVSEFLNQNPGLENEILKKGQNSTCNDLVNRYNGEWAIWNIVEVLSFNDFINLYELYYAKYESSNNMRNNLRPVKFLRNAAAHNNCLINNLRGPFTRTITPNKKINVFISKIPGIRPGSREKKWLIRLYMILLSCYMSLTQL
jgi:abortive infection bacteriophage resistance protein